MLLKGVILGILFGVALYMLVIFFDLVMSGLYFASRSIDNAMLRNFNSTVYDYSYVDRAANAVKSVAYLLSLAFIAIIVVYAIHTRRR